VGAPLSEHSSSHQCARHNSQARVGNLCRELSRAVAATRGHFGLQETLGHVKRHFCSSLPEMGSCWHLVGLPKDPGGAPECTAPRAAPQGRTWPPHGCSAEAGLPSQEQWVSGGRHSVPTKCPACSTGQELALERGQLRESYSLRTVTPGTSRPHILPIRLSSLQSRHLPGHLGPKE